MTGPLRYLRAAPRRGGAALFVDRDGVLNQRVVGGYVLSVEDLVPLRGALGAVRAAQRAGAAVVIVSNQGAIGRRLLDEGLLLAIHGALLGFLAAEGVEVDGIYVCPHHPEAADPASRACDCRKPEPGLLVAAAAELGLALGRSAMLGDQPSDEAAALAAGISPRAAFTVAAGAEESITSAVAAHFEEVGPCRSRQ